MARKDERGGKQSSVGAGAPKPDPAAAPFHSPFASLQPLRDALPAGATSPSPPGAATQRGPARAVVRREKKGRGGKEVTVIEQLALPAPQLAIWLKALKGALGCGGTVEGDALVLQGDQRDRAAALLESRGVRKVIRG